MNNVFQAMCGCTITRHKYKNICLYLHKNCTCILFKLGCQQHISFIALLSLSMIVSSCIKKRRLSLCKLRTTNQITLNGAKFKSVVDIFNDKMITLIGENICSCLSHRSLHITVKWFQKSCSNICYMFNLISRKDIPIIIGTQEHILPLLVELLYT
ncbi:hypothetical protein V1477_016523 [Vespula maculifrons]|uniref:Uncharacterized protein n=1 Tax=Vespula maculifrons TaxID=7453 RepID=A0ABD2B9D2_VESMC